MTQQKYDILDQLCQYVTPPACFQVCQYGGDQYGIFSAASPVESLHSLKLGLFQDFLTILLHKHMTKKGAMNWTNYAKPYFFKTTKTFFF